MTTHRAAALALLALAFTASAGRAQEAAPDPSAAELDVAPIALKKSPDRGSLTEEISTLQPSSTSANPTGPSYSNNLAAIFNLSDRWSLELGFLLSIDKGAPPPPGSNFPDSGGHVSLFTLGADWDSGEHWSFDLLTDLSPKSTTDSSTTLTTQLGNNGTAAITDARLNVTSSNLDLQAGAGYDTNGGSNAEWLFLAQIALGHLDTDQQVTAVQNRATGRSIGAAALATYCSNHPKICGKSLNAALQDRDYHLDSAKLDLGATFTAFEDTDLSLAGDYFVYAQDPSEVGYYNVATAGRALAGGAGVPIAPMRLDGRLDLVHRFGDLSLKLWGTAGEYAVAGDGITYGGGVKAQYRFSHKLRIWLAASLQHDLDDIGDDFATWGISAGVGVRF